MTSLEDNVKSLSMYIADLYFMDRDYENLSFYLADDITWIGTGKNEICLNKKEAIRFFEKEKEVFDGSFSIMDQWYECRQLSNDICYVMIILKVKLNIDHAILPCDTFRFSVIWSRKQRNIWKITHVHHSLPDASMGEETYFNLSIAESNYQKINDDIRKATNIDPLTKINNAQGFEYEVDQLFRKYPDHRYAVIKFGIRNFRFVNRRHSFSVGDEVLRNIAKNLTKTLHEDETCGRIEKDNFAILYHAESKKRLEQRLLKIRDRLIDKRLLKKLNMDIQLKAGVYIIEDNREYIQDMLDKALLALQSVSQTAQGSDHAYYEVSMLERHYFNSKILEDAPKAMLQDEFCLYIQPQFDIHTKEIIAGEALTRWKLKDGSIRMPDDFIPIFEANGMILSFDFYMLEKVCKQLREWIDSGLTIFPISINQSRLHIHEKKYLNDFCSIVDKYSIPHHYIAFELTESAFISDNDKMMVLANDLHQKGFQLAIDDFGTGYASINLLTEISADILKIDRMLLNDCENNPRSRIVMETIINLSHQLQMEVIAEGVETKEQLAFLKEMHCDIGQGFLVAKPIEAEQFINIWSEKT